MGVKRSKGKVGPDAVAGDGPHEESTAADNSASYYLDSENEPRKILVADGKMIAVSVNLAIQVGLVNAVILQQLAYLLFIAPDKGHWYAGRKWVWNTAKDWHAQLPFLSQKSIGNHLVELEKKGYVLSRQPGAYDRTKHYTIDYVTVDSAINHELDMDNASSAYGSSISGGGTKDKSDFVQSTSKDISKEYTNTLMVGEGIRFA